LLASGGIQSSDVWLWKVPTGEPGLLIPDAVDDCSIEALAFQPGGRLLALAGIDWLATSGSDGEVVLWHLDEHEEKFALQGGATAIAFHPAGRLLACAGLNRGIRLWDVVDDRVVNELKGHDDTVTCLAWSPAPSPGRRGRRWPASPSRTGGATPGQPGPSAIRGRGLGGRRAVGPPRCSERCSSPVRRRRRGCSLRRCMARSAAG